MAPLVRTGGSRHTGLAAQPHRNIHACVNKESLDIDVISEDCREIISMLLDNDLIEIKEV